MLIMRPILSSILPCLTLVLLMAVFTECNHKTSVDYGQLDTIQVKAEKVLEVDSVSLNHLVYPQILERDGKTLVTSINVVDNSVKIYNLATGQLDRTYLFAKEGPNKVGAVLSVSFPNSDAIFYLDQSSTLYVLDDSLKFLSRHSFKQAEQKGLPLFYANHIPLIHKSGDKLVAVNYYTNRTDRMLLLEVDLSTDSLRYFNPIPPEVVEGYYGMADFTYWNYVYNPNSKSYAFSFPASDSLYMYDADLNFTHKVSARSTLKTDEVAPPLPTVKSDDLGELRKFSQEEVMSRIKQSWAYHDLIYNPKKGHYYRFVGLPISEMDIEDGDPIRSEVRQFTLLVMNEDFETLNEYLLPYNKYLIEKDCFFIHSGDLYLQRHEEDEDRIYLDVLDL